MIRSLFIATITFVSLGAYYQGARDSLLEHSGSENRTELLRVARSSALFAVSRMKEALSERWIDQRTAGGYGGGTYRAVAVLKRHRGIVRAVGIAQREETETASYNLRVDVLRRPRSLADASLGYDVLIKAPDGAVED